MSYVWFGLAILFGVVGMWAAFRAPRRSNVVLAAACGVAVALFLKLFVASRGLDFSWPSFLLEGAAVGFMLGVGARIRPSQGNHLGWLGGEIVLSSAAIVAQSKPLRMVLLGAAALVLAAELLFVRPRTPAT
jgi:ABC-type Fe3+-siderophore transport system permease subunit